MPKPHTTETSLESEVGDGFTFGSLFAGIGGFDLGLERAGWSCAWQVEKDPFCNRVLQRHWPNIPRFPDVREVGASNLERVDLVCGGFPCQPWSAAGKRRGARDDRHLWPEMARIVSELRPRWVVGENVLGLFGPQLDSCASDLENAGYTVWPVVLPACALDAPHRRERLFLIAGRSDNLADPARELLDRRWTSGPKWWSQPPNRRENVADADGARLERRNGSGVRECSGQRSPWPPSPSNRRPAPEWEPEPELGRVADGIPRRVDRLRSLGNAVVPAVAHLIGDLLKAVSQSVDFQEL